MLMRRLWILCLLGCADVPADNPYDPEAPESVQARGTITGRIVLPDGFGARLLESARVHLEGGREIPEAARPDEAGAFAFHDVVAGRYLVRVQLAGLVAAIRVVALAVGEDRDLGEIELAAGQGGESTGVVVGVFRREPSLGDEHGGVRGSPQGPPNGLTALPHGRRGHATGVDHDQIRRTGVREVGEPRLPEFGRQRGGIVLIHLAAQGCHGVIHG